MTRSAEKEFKLGRCTGSSDVPNWILHCSGLAVQPPVELVHDDGDRGIACDGPCHSRRQIDWLKSFGTCLNVPIAVSRAAQPGHQPIDQLRHHVASVMAHGRVEQPDLIQRELKSQRRGKAKIRELDLPAIGEYVSEVRIKVLKVVCIHEGNSG